MSQTASGGQGVPVEQVKQLIELMEQHGLSELEVRSQGVRIRLRRGGEGGTVNVVPSVALPAAAPAPVSSSAPAPQDKKPAEEQSQYVYIRSPMVGTFYAAPKPGEPPYVQVGDRVQPDTTVCIIEAMKVFNEIQAEVSGRIVEVLVENGEPVEYNQPLFKVDPNG